jgi:hypothetical protein
MPIVFDYVATNKKEKEKDLGRGYALYIGIDRRHVEGDNLGC